MTMTMQDNQGCYGGGSDSKRVKLALLICLHIITCCVSLIFVANLDAPDRFIPAKFHVFFDPARWHVAALVVATFALVSSVFVFARFSFGYFVGFYSYTMILGYLWLGRFTDLNYNGRLAGLSAAASAVAFLLPALFVTSPAHRWFTLTAKSFDQLLTCILILGIAIVAVGAAYNFHLVGLRDMYQYRAKLAVPTIVNYLVTIFSSALLPFAFAGFVTTRAHWRGVAILVLLLFFYPITLNKVALFTPLWLIALLILLRFFEARIVTVLSLLGPVLAGVLSIAAFGSKETLYFYTVNFRMIAVPSIAMDVYNDFFATHDRTSFCQISIVKWITQCPYQDQLSIVMERTYGLGAFNASLFSTEGIASVGSLFAPVTALGCGLVFALANRLSTGLSDRFVLLSGAIFPPILLNVPLTTTLLTHGAAFLFLLWYMTPRTIFGHEAGRKNR